MLDDQQATGAGDPYPLPPRPGAARAYDYEYQRNGVSNLFMLFAPQMAPGGGYGPAHDTGRRWCGNWWMRTMPTRTDSAVMDKPEHPPSSLYQAFELAEARRIAERLEIHYTPKHGSWLTLARTVTGAAMP